MTQREVVLVGPQGYRLQVLYLDQGCPVPSRYLLKHINSMAFSSWTDMLVTAFSSAFGLGVQGKSPSYYGSLCSCWVRWAPLPCNAGSAADLAAGKSTSLQGMYRGSGDHSPKSDTSLKCLSLGCTNTHHSTKYYCRPPAPLSIFNHFSNACALPSGALQSCYSL